jgi:hypothetical protein
VEEECLVTNDGNELPYDQYRSWNYAGEMQVESDLVQWHVEVVEGSWCELRPGEVDVQQLNAGEAKAEHGAGEDEEQDEIITLFEADGVVEVSNDANEGIRVGVVDVKGHCV